MWYFGGVAKNCAIKTAGMLPLCDAGHEGM